MQLAIDFNGSSYFGIMDSSSVLNGLEHVSVSLWVKSDSTSVDRGFFGYGPSSSGDRCLRVDMILSVMKVLV